MIAPKQSATPLATTKYSKSVKFYVHLKQKKHLIIVCALMRKFRLFRIYFHVAQAHQCCRPLFLSFSLSFCIYIVVYTIRVQYTIMWVVAAWSDSERWHSWWRIATPTALAPAEIQEGARACERLALSQTIQCSPEVWYGDRKKVERRKKCM